jgi:hypothetical protein
MVKISKAHFALRATAFQIYYFLIMKLDAQPAAMQERRVVICSKGEIERFFKIHPNTIRLALDLELERDFKLIVKLPDEPGKAKNRIKLTVESEWNFVLIRKILYEGTAKRSSPKANESLFDEVLDFAPGTSEEDLGKTDRDR